MPIHNYADVYAIVRGDPILNSKGSQIMCPLATIRGTRDYVSQKVLNQYKYCSFFVLSGDTSIVQEIKTWKNLDIVRVTGFIQTKDIEQKAPCPVCETMNLKRNSVTKSRSGGNIIYVHPVFARKLSSNTDQQIAHLNLIDNAEISNRVFLIGKVVNNPERHELIDKVYTRFQLYVEHEYCVDGSEDLRESLSFPWIYSYGENAEKDFLSLHTGANVFIDGAIQSRRYKDKYVCSNCGEIFDVQGKTLEIVSYATEYLSECNFDSFKESLDTQSR